jgi:hypothetical protein
LYIGSGIGFGTALLLPSSSINLSPMLEAKGNLASPEKILDLAWTERSTVGVYALTCMALGWTPHSCTHFT